MKDDKFPRDRFLYIWRYIHLEDIEPSLLSTEEDFENIKEEDDGNILPTQQKMTHQEYDEEQREHWEHDDDSIEQANNDNKDYDTSSDYDTDTKHDDDRGVNLWYQKVKKFLDHINKISKKCCTHPGFALSINKMMKLFKGRSNITYWMKKKPIKEGFKFFAMCDASNGFVYYYLPSGLNEKRKRTIADTLVKMAKQLPGRRRKQYVITMDNYFTNCSKMKGLRKKGVAGLGTACAK